MADLYQFMRKILEKYNWDQALGEKMLREYHGIRPISQAEWKNLQVRFTYPEKYLETGKLLLFPQESVDLGKEHGKTGKPCLSAG